MRGSAITCISVKTESTEAVFTVPSLSTPDLTEKRDVESQTQLCSSQGSCFWHLLVDLPVLIIALVALGLFELGVIPSNKAGFYCNDPALAFPYRGDTVSTSILMVGLLLMPVVVFLLTEYVISTDVKYLQTFKNSCWLYRSYLYGLAMNLGVVEVMKGIVGGPRPTFFDLCKPDALLTCNGSEYVSTFECTSSFSRWQQMDSSRSFPSGHTSMSVYCGFFLAWYLQTRAFDWRHRSILLVPLVQLCVISFSIVSSLTRITDHRHHWWDVLTGAGIGFLSLFYAVFCLCNSFARRGETNQPEVPNTHNDTNLLNEDRSRARWTVPCDP